ARGSPARSGRALRKLEPEIDTFDMVPPVALSRLHNDPEEPMPVITDHRLLGELTPEAIDAFVAHAGPGSGSAMLMAEIRHLGGALGVAKPGNGALAKLDAGYMVFGGGLAIPESVPALRASLGAFKDAFEQWDAGTAYLNFEENTADSR